MVRQMNLDFQHDNEMYLVWYETKRWWTIPDPRDADEDCCGMGHLRRVQQYERTDTLYAIVKSRYECDRLVPNLQELAIKETNVKGDHNNREGKEISFRFEHARFADITQFCERAKEQLTLNPIYRTI